MKDTATNNKERTNSPKNPKCQDININKTNNIHTIHLNKDKNMNMNININKMKKDLLQATKIIEYTTILLILIEMEMEM